MRVMIALGGNAVLMRGEPMTAEMRRKKVRAATPALARIAASHKLVLFDSTDPQVGPLALRAAAYNEDEPYPPDILGARSTVLTTAGVDATKSVGPVLAETTGWTFGLRLDMGATVVCAGDAGVPTVFDGVDAVVDKDFAGELLAREMAADLLVMATDVNGVYVDWGTPWQRRLERVTPAELRKEQFAAGSMGPKVDAAVRFVESTRKRAAIGTLADIEAIIDGNAGTQVTPHSP